MTDLSKFDGHTQGQWHIGSAFCDYEGFDANVLVNDDGDDASEVDLELMAAAPALLARVRELEALLDSIHDGDSRRGSIDRMLNKEWL